MHAGKHAFFKCHESPFRVGARVYGAAGPKAQGFGPRKQ
ncbi:hypothetical protein APY04_2038 [Hyphomicrobium sulfonivorans]|uniref:Uncharacterized protein n=1 Tax=Hyphomicrobium sulfonivorans TaxID=121290 RepID=A0A109BE29_HYPSL|nr:hypothetical protein APY04_2038 [Hyphomicrobium sulfonivorans]